MSSRSRSANVGPNVYDRRWIALAAFMLIVVMMGGGSRSDLASLPFLRAASVLFATAALAMAPMSASRDVRGALFLLALLAIWMAAQLVPLPPDFWASLPLRDKIYRIDQLLGEGDRWRPISMTPSLTVNSLLALTVPVAAIILAAATPATQKIRIWWLIWAFGVLSSLFGLMQLATGAGSAVYLYRITNEGAIVGLFANRNHFAVLLSIAILAAGWLISYELMRRNRRIAVVGLLSGSLLLFLFLVLAVGSRFGLIGGFISAAATLVIVRRRADRRPAALNQPGRRSDATTPSNRVMRAAFGILPVVSMAAIGALFYASDKENAVTRLVDGSGAPEMRVAAFSTVADLAQTQWLLGSGFGSFARVFQIVEPDSLLQPVYLNQAHNDWLQVPIEGGLPAILIMGFAIIWTVRRLALLIFRHARSGDSAVLTEALFLAVAFICLALGGAVEFPIRSPSMMMVVALLVVLLIRCGQSRPDEAASVL